MLNWKVFIAVFVVAVLLDFIWLGVFASSFYQRELGNLYTQKVNIAAGIFVYLLMALGISFFVVSHSSVSSSLTAFGVGALFGFILYAVYDFTNLAVLTHYPLRLAIVDVLWGSLLCGALSVLGYRIM